MSSNKQLDLEVATIKKELQQRRISSQATRNLMDMTYNPLSEIEDYGWGPRGGQRYYAGKCYE